MIKKQIITWKKLDSLLQEFVDSYIKTVPVTCITGIPRGGAIIALLLSHKLNLPYVPIDVAKLGELKGQILVVDDIADSGTTLDPFIADYWTYTLHWKQKSIAKPTFYSVEVPNEGVWIVYPWEKKDADTKPDYTI